MSTLLTFSGPLALVYVGGHLMQQAFGSTFTTVQYGLCFVAAGLFHFYWHGFGDSN